MSSIFEKISEQLEQLEEQFEENISAPGRNLEKIRETLASEGMISSFAANSSGVSDGWLAAIDGGTAIEKLSTGDLIMAGSTIAGGSYREPFFSESEDLTEVWFAIKPHTNSNEELLSVARAVQEVRIFARSAPAGNVNGVRVIDGAWLGNVSTVLYGFLSKDNSLELLSMNNYDSDGFLAKGLEELLTVDSNNRLTAVALTKSDSDRSYVSKWSNPKEGEFIIDPDDARNYTDRFVTSYVLKPGEFVQPRNVMYNENLYKRLLDADTHLERSLSGARDRKRMAEALRDYNQLMKDMNDNNKLWTTYFKPSEFTEYSKSLKIEFVFDGNGLTGKDLIEAVTNHARLAIETVNSDIHSSSVLEPMCQYNVDRQAKEVSGAMRLALNHLSSRVSEDDALRNLVRGYRT